MDRAQRAEPRAGERSERAARPARRLRALRRFAPEIAVLAMAALAYAALATYASFEWHGEERLNRAYDYLGDSLLRGEVTVPTNAETLRVGGKDIVYFAPLPALLRIPLNAIWPEHFGQWGRITTFAAALVALLAWMRIVRAAAPSLGRAARWLLYAGFAFGTPLVYLVSSPYVWHEAMTIALAASLWALAFLVPMLLGAAASPRAWLGLGIAASAAYLTRLTFGFPHLLVAAWLVFDALFGGAIATRLPALARFHRPDLAAALRRPRNAACLLLPLACSIAFYSWYNLERFGNPLVYHDYSKVLAYLWQPELLAHHERIGTFNVRRIPTNARNYFGASGRIDTAPPFVHFTPNRGMGPDLYLPGYREWNIALWAVSGWLVLGAALGLGVVLVQRRLFEAMVALAFAGQLVVVLTYYWVSHRFSAELLPGLCLLFGFALAAYARVQAEACAGRDALPPALRTLLRSRAAAAGFALLIALSMPLTFASTLAWQAEFNWGAPPAYRARLQQLFGSSGSPATPGTERAARPPTR